MRNFIFAFFALTACTDPTMDFAGNVYPPICHGDLSYVKAPIIELSPNQMRKVQDARHETEFHHGRLFGFTAYGIIVIDSTLMGWVRDETIHHERCHIIAGNWHK